MFHAVPESALMSCEPLHSCILTVPVVKMKESNQEVLKPYFSLKKSLAFQVIYIKATESSLPLPF